MTLTIKAQGNTNNRRVTTTPVFTLKVPFVSDQLNHQIRRTLARHDISARLVNPRGKTIKDLARRPDSRSSKQCQSKTCPAPAICQRNNVVYLATCDLCDDEYIGMTTRRLHDRARGHVRSANMKDDATDFSDHYCEHHKPCSPRITFKILTHQPDLLRLHIEEALRIKQHRPSLNRRQEMLGTGFLP